MYIAQDWQDYEVIDCGEGYKYERWGKLFLLRPDPQVIWPFTAPPGRVDATYRRSDSGGGNWEGRVPEPFYVNWRSLRFALKTMGFKHTGLFPEQAANWAWMTGLIEKANRPVRVLNLFGYTGGATAALAAAGASVVHVDAAKNMIAMGKENLALSGLAGRPVRWIVDDCKKFVEREIRRGNTYEGILLDPPSYGRGPSGELWKLETEIYPLLSLCARLLSEKPLFFLLNSYTTGLQPAVLQNLLQKTVSSLHGGRAEAGEVCLPVTKGNLLLPCGASARWQAEA